MIYVGASSLCLGDWGDTFKTVSNLLL